jgi:hypothetical protein
MQARAVRVQLRDTFARFNGRDATLVNISRSGALLQVDETIGVGTLGRLILSQRSTTIEIDGKVVREVDRPSRSLETDARQVGIAFVSPNPQEVTALLRRLIAVGS